MQFGDKNAHLKGINNVCGNFLYMASVKHCLVLVYFMNSVWAIIDDICKCLNEILAKEDLTASASFTL